VGGESNEPVRRGKPDNQPGLQARHSSKDLERCHPRLLGEGDKNNHHIFGAVVKFAKDVDKSLTEFKDALLALSCNLRELSSQKPESRVRLHELKNFDDDAQVRRRKAKAVVSRGDDGIATLSPENKPVEKKKPVEERKPKKEEILVPAKEEADSDMQEAQGLHVAPIKDIRVEDSSWTSSRPVPSGPMPTTLGEPAFTMKALAAKYLKDGKL
jgi:hypothetical protein